MGKVSSLFVFAVVVALHTVQPCCFPKSFEGQLEITLFNYIGKPTYVFGQGYAAMDINRQMIYFKGKMSQDRNVTTVEVLEDYRNHIQYVVLNGKCTTSRIGSKMFSCIPKNATRVPASYYGYDAEHINIDVFKIKEPLAEVTLTVMKDTCAPLRIQVYTFVSVEYMLTGLKSGVTNQTIFNPPPACKSAVIPNDQEAHYLKLHQQLFNI